MSAQEHVSSEQLTAIEGRRRRWPQALVVVVALLVSVVGLSVATPAAAQSAGEPFDCSQSTIFVAQGTSTDPMQLYRLVYGAGSTSFELVGPAVDQHYNAVSYNEADGFLYAVGVRGTTIRHLLRIDATGAVTDLGLVSGLPTGSDASRLNDGAFGDDGYLYVGEIQESDRLYRVDIDTLEVTVVMLSQPVQISDSAFVDGYLWGLQTATSETFVRIDPATGATTTFPNALIPTGASYGAAWTYGNGNVGFSNNATGQVYEISITNPSSASPSFQVVSNVSGPASTGNDGASCVSQPLDLGVDKTGPDTVEPGGAITWTVTVTNNGPGTSSGHSVTDIVTEGVTDVASPDEACSVAESTVQCVSGALAPGASVSYTITGTAPLEPGTLVNDATVVGFEEDTNPDNDTDDHETEVTDVQIPLVASWPAGAAGLLLVAGGVGVLTHRRQREALASAS
jgi:uncharacterized repeat protein (TIGR01451 family)